MKKPSSTKAALSPREDKRAEAQRREAMQRLHQRFAHIPAGVSLADELLSERRAEAEREG
jgi:hypothetical protein